MASVTDRYAYIGTQSYRAQAIKLYTLFDAGVRRSEILNNITTSLVGELKFYWYSSNSIASLKAKKRFLHLKN